MESKLPPSIQSSSTPNGAVSARTLATRLTTREDLRAAREDHAALARGRDMLSPRFAGTCDTAVDPLQLIWLVARERDDFSNF